MFILLIDRGNQVLLSRLSGVLNPENWQQLESAARKSAASDGPMRALFDLSDVETIDISVDHLMEVAQRQQHIPNQVRVYVIPANGSQFGMARLFGTYSALAGNVEPVIVHSMAEAYRVLQITDPNFQMIEPTKPSQTA
jgi:hypothetical protein